MLRLIVSPPAPGADQMATDDALLTRCAQHSPATVPVLRVYQFSPACISIGYFQLLSDIDGAACARDGIDVVRRPTGGRAVLHQGDIAYALVAPAAHTLFVGGVRASAARIGGLLAAALHDLGIVAAGVALPVDRPRPVPPDCFGVTGAYEVAAAGTKLIGSAQVRRDGAALQHGAIRLNGTPDITPAYLGGTRPLDQPVLPLPTVNNPAIATTVSSVGAMARALGTVIAHFLDTALVPEALTVDEVALAAQLAAERYRAPAWTARR